MVRKLKSEKRGSVEKIDGESDLTLVPYRGTPFSVTREIESWPEDHRRRWAIKAVQERCLDDLWRLMQAYICLHGLRGPSTSSETFRSYERGLKAILEYSSERGLDMIRPSHDAARTWLGYLSVEGVKVRRGKNIGERQPMKPSTISVSLTSVKTLYEALCWVGAVQENPFKYLHSPTDPVSAHDKRQPYSDSSVEAMLQVSNPMEKILILLAAHAGLRSSEALALRIGDIDFSSREIIVRKGKGSKMRRVILSTTLYSLLAELPREDPELKILPHSSDGWVRLRTKSICQRSGVKYMTYHSLRHYCGTRLMDILGDLSEVARHLGHSKIETARIYAKWNNKKLKSALDDL